MMACMRARVCVCRLHKWRSEDNLWTSVLYSHCVCCRDGLTGPQTLWQVLSHLLSHLASSKFILTLHILSLILFGISLYTLLSPPHKKRLLLLFWTVLIAFNSFYFLSAWARTSSSPALNAVQAINDFPSTSDAPVLWYRAILRCGMTDSFFH